LGVKSKSGRHQTSSALLLETRASQSPRSRGKERRNHVPSQSGSSAGTLPNVPAKSIHRFAHSGNVPKWGQLSYRSEMLCKKNGDDLVGFSLVLFRGSPEVRKQWQVISFDPTIECTRTDPFQGKQKPWVTISLGYRLAWLCFGTRRI
jgi:hypothetical protein